MPFCLLEARQAGARQRPVDTVDGGPILTLGAQRDLQRRHARARGGGRGPRERTARHESNQKHENAAHTLLLGRSKADL